MLKKLTWLDKLLGRKRQPRPQQAIGILKENSPLLKIFPSGKVPIKPFYSNNRHHVETKLLRKWQIKALKEFCSIDPFEIDRARFSATSETSNFEMEGDRQ